MLDDPSERVLTMTIEGGLAQRGRVPIEILARKLDTMQEVLYSFANASESSSAATRGKWSKNITSSCRLLFRNFKRGSLTIEAEVNEPEESDVLPGMDFGKKALSDFKEASRAIENADIEHIQRTMPNSSSRERFLNKYKELCPREGDDYEISLGNGKGESFSKLTIKSRKIIDDFKFQEIDTKYYLKTSIEGEFIEIRIGDEKRHFALKTIDREIRCGYPPEMEQYISQIPAGSVVRIHCDLEIKKDGSIKDIEKVYDVDVINFEPPVFNKFTWENRRFVLIEAVAGNLKYEDNLWIYEVPRYNLHSYSENRKEALNHLNEEFAFLYDGLFFEKDETLTGDAIELRNLIRNDIENVEEIG